MLFVYDYCGFFFNSKEEGEKYHQTRQAIQPANTPNDTERSHDPFPIPRSDNNQPNPFAEFMSMMAKNMGSMEGMGGMMSMMGALMGGGMPSPTTPEEPTSTVLDIARSSSTSPDSGLSACSMMSSPSEVTPDSTTESVCRNDSFDAPTQRYSESSCGQFDDGYCSGTGQRFSSSTSSPYPMDPFSPYSDTFLPSNQPPTTHAQMYIKEEYSRMSPVSTMSSMSPSYDQSYQRSSPVQQTSSYNPHCRYTSMHLTSSTHIKQEPLTTTYRPEPYSVSPQCFPNTTPQINPPVTITSEVFPATLPILNDKDLQILDLEQSLRETVPSSGGLYRNPCTH